MSQQHGLGRGLASLIPPKQATSTSTVADNKLTAGKQPVIPDVFQAIPLERPAADGQSVIDVPVGKILPNPHQPRADFSEERLRELAESIREHGILQPLIVTKRGESYELIAGERRLQASKLAGLETVPVIVRDVEEQQKFELAIIENIQRHDLNALEEARAYQRLIEEFGMTQESVAKKMGKSRSLVANTLRLLQLPIEIQRSIVGGKVSEGHAKAILGVEGLERQMALYEAIIKEQLTVREAEARSRSVAAKPKKYTVTIDPSVQAAENQLTEKLGTRVRIARAGKGGRVVIEYYSQEDLGRILQELTHQE